MNDLLAAPKVAGQMMDSSRISGGVQVQLLSYWWEHRARLSACVLAVAAVFSGTACGNDSSESASDLSSTTFVDSPSPSPTSKAVTSTTAVPPSTSVPPTTLTPDPPADVADALIGTWASTDPGAAEFVYRFDPDSTYAWVGVIVQQRASGVFRYTVQAEGQYEVSQHSIRLQPLRASKSREDPDDPAGDYTDIPTHLDPSMLTWSIDAAGILQLTDAKFGTMSFTRQD
jgi:hypothetical protein